MPNIGDNCIDRIECELYYEPDWDFVLKAEFTCAEIETKKPCFGTFACVCDNDYKSVSEKMPEPSADKQAELDKLEGVDVDDEDGIQTWHIIVGASGLIAIIAIIVLVCCLRKQKNETAIKPMQGSVEMGPRKVPKL